MNIKKFFKLDMSDVDVENYDDGNVNIHFGDIPNDNVPEYLKEIDRGLRAHAPAGKADILVTEGSKSTLITVMYFKPWDESDKNLYINRV